MKKSIVLFVLSLSLLVSCKDEKATEIVAEKPAKNVKVTVNAIVKTDDNFQLFFREGNDISTPFEEENSVWTKVAASDAAQNIEFVLPEDVLPYYLRLDLGTNAEQQGITITGMKIDYLEKNLSVSPSTFFESYFIPNNSIEIKDKVKGEVMTKKDAGGIYDPVFNSGENLKVELDKLYR